MKRRTKPNPGSTARIVAVVAAAAVVALSFAVPLLGHAIGTGRVQWAEGAFTASLAGGAGAFLVAVVTTVWSIQDRREWNNFQAALDRTNGH